MDIRNTVVETAKKYLGIAYKKMNCSQLVYKVLSDLGYTLKPNSTNQAKILYDKGLTVAIDKGETVSNIAKMLNPGDLIFWSNPKYTWRWKYIHHVGFYVGNSKTIESTGSGNGVHIGSLWESPGTGNWQIIFIVDITKVLNIQEETDMLLKKGSKGKDVVWVQWALVTLKYQGKMDIKIINENTPIGDNTQKSIMDFQEDNGLPITGEVDNATFSMLLQKLVEKSNRDEVYISGIGTAYNMKR
jgi:peptidoglycan hydrolase-like protein with peptidoglycan-binding domain